MRERYYFAYGSNMSPEQMRVRCPGAVKVSSACLPGWRFLINQRGVATIRRVASALCRGGVWRISPWDEWSLDRYEGVAEGRYRKVIIAVKLRNGRTVDALTYIDPRVQEGIPREGYLIKILTGAVHFKLPHEYLESLLEWAGDEDLDAWRAGA